VGNNESPARKPRTKKPSQDAAKDPANGETAPNPDPAVFEAAFVIDDSEEPSRAGTPKPIQEEKSDMAPSDGAPDADMTKETSTGKDVDDAAAKEDGGAQPAAVTTSSAPSTSELPPEVRAKLRRLAKMETTYQGMPVLANIPQPRRGSC
jgi:hypothetical protein